MLPPVYETKPSTPFSRRLFLAGLAPALRAAERSPNLVIFTADGWRGASVKSKQDGYLVAPNLERLGREGLEFSRAYAARPVPAVGESPILTGRFPHRHDNTPILRTELQEMGYVWGDLAGGSMDRLVEFVRTNRTKVFAAWLPMPIPLHPAPRLLSLYEGKPVFGRANMPEDRGLPGWRDYPRYYAALSEADAALGRLLGVLDETNLAAGTILIFTSHCGEMLGSHGLTGADEFYEESACVPLIVRYPRHLKPSAPLEFPVSLTDLAPTLLALCGAEVPRALHGRNLAPLLSGAAVEPPESVFVEGRLGSSQGWRMVVRGVSKLVVNLQHQVTGLYNIGLDPFEMENQATPRATELTRAEMMVILRDWMSRTGDWAARPR